MALPRHCLLLVPPPSPLGPSSFAPASAASSSLLAELALLRAPRPAALLPSLPTRAVPSFAPPPPPSRPQLLRSPSATLLLLALLLSPLFASSSLLPCSSTSRCCPAHASLSLFTCSAFPGAALPLSAHRCALRRSSSFFLASLAPWPAPLLHAVMPRLWPARSSPHCSCSLASLYFGAVASPSLSLFARSALPGAAPLGLLSHGCLATNPPSLPFFFFLLLAQSTYPVFLFYHPLAPATCLSPTCLLCQPSPSLHTNFCQPTPCHLPP